MKAKFVKEEFKETSDPIVDMGIGEYPRKIAELRKTLRAMFDEEYERVEEDDEHTDIAWERIEVIQLVQEELNKLFGPE
jgi:hypothetical protein